MTDGPPDRWLRRASETVDDVVAWRLSARLVAGLLVTALVVAALPHTLGAVGADAVGTGGEPPQEDVEDPRQRQQNVVASDAIHVGPWMLLFVALAASFVAATRSREPRRRLVASASLGVAVGTVVGYVGLVALAHLAYAPTANGYIVESGPVVFRAWATAGNALGIAVPATVGSALVAASGTLAGPTTDEPARPDDSADEHDPGADANAAGERVGTDGADPSTDADRPDTVAIDGTGPSGAPAYDPSERDWEGTEDER